MASKTISRIGVFVALGFLLSSVQRCRRIQPRRPHQCARGLRGMTIASAQANSMCIFNTCAAMARNFSPMMFARINMPRIQTSMR